MNRFYIGSSFQNKNRVKQIAELLKVEGLTFTYDWTLIEKVENSSQLTEIGNSEVQGIKEADVVLILLPGGRGTHTELGLAIAMEKHVLLFDLENRWNETDRQVSFYYVNGVKRVMGDIRQVIEEMKKAAADLEVSPTKERGL